MNETMITTCSQRHSWLSAFWAKLGLTRNCPEKSSKIENNVKKNTNRRKNGITGKDRKMDTNVENTGVELAEIEATVTEAEATEIVSAETITAPVIDKPAEPVYDGPMTISTRKKLAKDGKSGRGRGNLVCVAKTPADAEKIVARVKATLPADEVVHVGQYSAPTFVSADEFIASLDRTAAVSTKAAEIIKARNLSPEDLAAVLAAFGKLGK
jgi:hypothetical protein